MMYHSKNEDLSTPYIDIITVLELFGFWDLPSLCFIRTSNVLSTCGTGESKIIRLISLVIFFNENNGNKTIAFPIRHYILTITIRREYKLWQNKLKIQIIIIESLYMTTELLWRLYVLVLQALLMSFCKWSDISTTNLQSFYSWYTYFRLYFTVNFYLVITCDNLDKFLNLSTLK